MERTQIVDGVLGVLKSGGGALNPYREELFALCRAAHEAGPTEGSPSLSADGLTQAIRAQWPEWKRNQDVLRELHTLWRAWLYAFTQLL